MPCDCKDSCCDGLKCCDDLVNGWKALPIFQTSQNVQSSKVTKTQLLAGTLYSVFHPDEFERNFSQQLDIAGDDKHMGQKTKLGEKLITDFTLNFSTSTCCTDALLPSCGCPYSLPDYASQEFTYLRGLATPVRWVSRLPGFFWKSLGALPAASFVVCGIQGAKAKVNREGIPADACCNGVGCTFNCCCSKTDTCEYNCKDCSAAGNCGTGWPLIMYYCGATTGYCIRLSTAAENTVIAGCDAHPALGVASAAGALLLVPTTTTGLVWGGSLAASYLLAPCLPVAATSIATTMTLDFAITAGLAHLGCVALDSVLNALDKKLATNNVCIAKNKPVTAAMDRNEVRGSVTRIGADPSSPPAKSTTSPSANGVHHLAVPLSAKTPSPLTGNLTSSAANGNTYKVDVSPKSPNGAAASRPQSAPPASVQMKR